MIDLHCHVLPGLDDGAPDTGEALAMLEIAAADGIETVVATPHAFDGVFNNNDVDAIRAAVDALAADARKMEIAIDLRAGADVHVSTEITELHKAGRLPTLNGTRYFLLEFPHTMVPHGIDPVLFEWQVAGLIPILTHPERNAELATDLPRVADLVRRGVLMQVTAASLAGELDAAAEEAALTMLSAGCIHFLATDAHSSTWRRPVLSAARERAAELTDAATARALVLDNPRLVLANEPIAVAEPVLSEPPPKPWYKRWNRRGG